MAYDRPAGRFESQLCLYTGEISWRGYFYQCVVGSILQGDSLPIAQIGVQFITTGIRASYGYEYPRREGIFERVLSS